MQKTVSSFRVKNKFEVWFEGKLRIQSMWTDGFPWPLNRVVKLAYKLMELVALSLGLPADRFHGFFKDQTSYIRLNHYNPCPAPPLALGLGRHQDSGVLIILNEDDVGGLEVKWKTDGEWVRVKSTPGAYIINIGDTTQVQFSINQIKFSMYNMLAVT